MGLCEIAVGFGLKLLALCGIMGLQIKILEGKNMCFICDRINMTKNGTNPYFVKELETGYVVLGDNQHFKGYSLFLCKNTKQNYLSWIFQLK